MAGKGLPGVARRLPAVQVGKGGPGRLGSSIRSRGMFGEAPLLPATLVTAANLLRLSVVNPLTSQCGNAHREVDWWRSVPVPSFGRLTTYGLLRGTSCWAADSDRALLVLRRGLRRFGHRARALHLELRAEECSERHGIGPFECPRQSGRGAGGQSRAYGGGEEGCRREKAALVRTGWRIGPFRSVGKWL